MKKTVTFILYCIFQISNMFREIFTPFDSERPPRNESVNYLLKFLRKFKIENFCGVSIERCLYQFGARPSPFLFIHFRKTDFNLIVEISEIAQN